MASLAGRPPLRDERVRVHCRLRPTKDVDEMDGKLFELVGEEGEVNFQRSPGEKKNFAFDSFFGAATSQERVYEEVAKDIVGRVLNGYNGTLFAYGQTGTGKSHTMMGPPEQGEAQCEGPQRGVVPRALEQICPRGDGGGGGEASAPDCDQDLQRIQAAAERDCPSTTGGPPDDICR